MFTVKREEKKKRLLWFGSDDPHGDEQEVEHVTEASGPTSEQLLQLHIYSEGLLLSLLAALAGHARGTRYVLNIVFSPF